MFANAAATADTRRGEAIGMIAYSSEGISNRNEAIVALRGDGSSDII